MCAARLWQGCGRELMLQGSAPRAPPLARALMAGRLYWVRKGVLHAMYPRARSGATWWCQEEGCPGLVLPKSQRGRVPPFRPERMHWERVLVVVSCIDADTRGRSECALFHWVPSPLTYQTALHSRS